MNVLVIRQENTHRCTNFSKGKWTQQNKRESRQHCVWWIQTSDSSRLLMPMWEGKKKVRKCCRAVRHATKTHASPPHKHTHKSACSPAHSAPTRWARRAVAAQWSGTSGGWTRGGHWGWEAARWRGGCRLGTGRSVPVQWGVRARLSALPLVSSLLSLPFFLYVCVCVRAFVCAYMCVCVQYIV